MHIKRYIGLFLFATVLAVIATACSTSGNSHDNYAMYGIPEESYPVIEENPQSGNFDQSAKDLVVKMGSGWNLGNTLDAHDDSITTVATETCWGQPKATKEMMKGLKNSGIKTVRIPISWHNHVNAAFTVDSKWMARVKEVVDYAIDEGLYVIINIHHDNSKLYYFPDSEHAQQSQAYVTRIWKQAAEQFKNYNEYLIFETLNEPRLVGYANEWNWSDSDAKLRDAAEQINILNQQAVDVIRATGSNNAKRFIMFTPYVASPWSANSSHFAIPTDTATDKLILSIHAYTPYNFAMQAPGITTFGSGQKEEIDSFMSVLNTKFVKEGIPVVLGEYGATNKNNLADRVEYFSYYVKKAHYYGMCPIVWDNSNYAVPASGKFEELYGFYNRTEHTWYFPEILTAITAN